MTIAPSKPLDTLLGLYDVGPIEFSLEPLIAIIATGTHPVAADVAVGLETVIAPAAKMATVVDPRSLRRLITVVDPIHHLGEKLLGIHYATK